MSACCLCSDLVSVGRDKPWNQPLFETENFVVLPSLGSLVEGWLLLVPRKHYINMGAVSIDLAEEAEQIKIRLIDALGTRYGELCVFEHGPAHPNRKVGCSVDHAHLHIVPLTFDLKTAALAFMPSDVKWLAGTWDSCRAAFESEQDYLYIEQPVGIGRIATHHNFESQVFRKAIAARMGMPEQFNWRNYPQKETVARTILALSSSVGTRL